MFEFSVPTAMFAAAIGPAVLAGGLVAAVVSLRRQAARAAPDRAVATQAQLREAIERMHEAFALWDADERLILCNDKFRESLGPHADLMRAGRGLEAAVRGLARSGWLRAVDPGCPEVVEGVVAEYLARHRAATAAMEYRCADGRWRRVSERRLSDGGTVTIWSDITELKEREAALRESEERLRDFAESSSDWFWEQDEELRFMGFSGNAMHLFPVPAETVLGRRREDFRLPEDDPDAWERHLADLAARRPFRDFRMRRQDGKGGILHISTSGRPVFDPDGRFKGYRGTGRNVTVKVEREERTRRQAGALQALIDNVPVGITLVDGALNTVAFNQRFLELLDFPAGRFRLGDPFEKFTRYNAERGEYGPGDVEEQVRSRIALARNPRAHRFERTRPDGRIIEIIGAPMPDGGFVTAYSDVTERRHAEERVKASEERFRDFAEATSDWFWEQDADLRFTYASASPTALQPEDFIGKTRAELRPLGVGEQAWNDHLADLAARRPFREFRYHRHDPSGRMRHLSISGKPIFAGDGRFLGYRGTGKDITAQVEAEARAHLAQTRLANAIDGIADGLAIFDVEDRLVVCNAAYRHMLGSVGHLAQPGVAFETLARATAGGGLIELDSEREAWVRERLAHHRDPRKPIELRRPCGTWLLVRDQRLADGGVAVIVSDITEIKERERQLGEKTSLLQATLDSMGEGISVFDKDMRMVVWNEQVLDLMDVPPEFYRVGTHLLDIVRYQARRSQLSTMPEAPPAAPLTDAQVEAEVSRYLAAMNQNGFWRSARWRSSGRYVEIRRNPMPDGGFVNVFSDLTARQRVEDALRHAKETAEFANRTKTEFLANMSHELRTPLNAIIGFAEILEQELLGPLGTSRYKEYSKDIRDSGNHLLTLINDILDVSKAEAGRIELNEALIRIDAVINASLRLVGERAREADIAVATSKMDHLPALRGDERRLKQVLLNLLSNAVKFTPAGGRVSVDVDADPSSGFRISVADTGIGMAPQDIPKAMQPFGQIDSALARKFEGTGLGLPLCKALVELHGGQIAIASEIGVGTTVTISLPPERMVLFAA